MTEDTDFPQIPQATPEPRKRIMLSVVWIIPLLAAVIALGIAVERFLSEGTTITIVFKTAEGIEAGKTFVKYKDVNIGQVTKVKLSADYSKVEITAKMDKSAEGLLVEDAKFWVVQPRITLSGISGIGTLLSGNYIGFETGKSSVTKTHFDGLEVPPIITKAENGRQFVLQTLNLGSLGIGSPLYYRYLNVGRVIAYDLATDGTSVNIRVFVKAPYDRYVTEETRFWQTSGVDLSVGANGLTVKTLSVLSMLIGGIAFEAPPFVKEDRPAAANSIFTLYNDKAIAMAREDGIVVNYVLYFNESLRGLTVGAPVTLHGLPIGEVTAVGLEYFKATADARPRVDIAVYPERFLKDLKLSRDEEAKLKNRQVCCSFLKGLVDRGLRAQLRSGNLLLGQLFVAFDFFPKGAPVKVDWEQATPRLPVMPSGLVDLESKINAILGKIDKIPFAIIGEELKTALVTTNQAMKDLSKTANQLDGEVLPEAKKTMEDLRRALVAAEAVLNSSERNLVGKDAQVQQELREALQEIARAARAISVFTEYLERNPSALIQGKTQEKPQ
jgi:paraquat-inducible protein B